MQNLIFYFSGSGNSLKIAKDIALQLGDCEILHIAKAMKEPKVYSNSKIGIIFPVHFWGVPPIVKKFVSQLQVSGKPYIYAIANAGGTGAAVMKQLQKEMNKNNLKLSASFCLSMPTSYIRWFDAVKPDDQKKIFEKAEKQTKEIVNKIKNNSNEMFTGSVFTNWFFSGYMYNRYVPKFTEMDKDFLTKEKCNGCGNCVKVCPVENIKLVDKKPEWQHNCTQCFACLQWCNQQAIEIKQNTVKRKRYHNPEIKLSEMILK